MTGTGPALARLLPHELDEQQRALYDTIAGGPRAAAGAVVPVVGADGALEGPFNALLFAPALGAAVQQVGAQLRFGTVLADRERELATLYVAGRLDSEYERYAHGRLAAAAGLTDDEITACSAGRVPAGLTGRERLVLEVAAALYDIGSVPAATRAAALAAVGERGLVELTVLVGYYRLLAGVLAVAGVGTPGG